jgi:hypothetical protein
MYYNDFQRIKRMEKMLERLAYLSVFLDAMVAVATFLVIRGVDAYSLMLTISNYFLTIEVAFAAVIFGTLIALKHYRKIIDGVALTSFRNKYPVTRKTGVMFVFRKLLQIVLAPFVSN